MAAATEKGYVRTAAGQLHFRQRGDGKPLVLLHQSPSSSAMWEPLLPLLAGAGFRAAALDMPGFGESYRPAAPPSLAVYAEAVLDFIRALNLAPVDLLGHHTGAAVALQAAAHDPGAVRRVVAWGIPLLDEKLQVQLAEEAIPEFDADGEAVKAYWSRRRLVSGAAYTTEVGIRCAIEMLQTGFTRPWGHWAVAKADLPAILKNVGQPVLVMAGQADPVWARSREATSLLPRARFVCLDEAGLDVVDERPEAFAAAVLDFLR